MNADNIILVIVGICIGVTITLLSTIVYERYANITIGSHNYEVVVDNFLGYDELMVVKRLPPTVTDPVAKGLLETDSQGRYNGIVE